MSKKHLICFCLPLILAACGGGGGGGSPVVGPVTATGLKPNATLSNATASDGVTFGEVHVGVNNANGQIDVGSASANVDDATVTLTTDSAGSIKSISFDHVPGTTADIGTSVTPVASGTLTAASIADAIGTGNNNALLAEKLTYSAYGLWASDDPVAGRAVGAFAVGQVTPADAVPTTGKATYSGSAIGVGSMSGGTMALQGSANLSADFGAQTITGAFSLNGADIAGNHPCGSAGCTATLSGSGGISGNTFSSGLTGSVTGAAGTVQLTSGAMAGGFFGPKANEVAGVFGATGTGATVGGSFGAKSK